MIEEIIKPDSQKEQEVVNQKNSQLWLINDDVNTFEFVIETLIELCGHDELQAEQCAMITHLKGKCSVKKGNVKELTPIVVAMFDRGLSAEIKN